MQQPFSPRVLLVTTALSLLAVGSLWVFPWWRMPGRLSLAHADYESQCTLCHRLWQGLAIDACLGCHEVIAEAQASGQGLHGADQRVCHTCHVEHRGREVYIVPTARGLAVKDGCINCHTNQNLLEAVASAEAQAQLALCDDCGGTLPPMAIADEFSVDAPALLGSLHGQQTCAGCHGGNPQVPVKAAAHQGLVPDPSADPARVCGQSGCHVNKVRNYASALHATLAGFTTTLQARTDEAHWPALGEAVGEACGYCHATCGQCHVSRPEAAGGGLLAGHTFVRRPPVEVTCRGCHGRRVEEYLGEAEGPVLPALSRVEGSEAEGTQPDAHVTQANLTCLDCHPGAALHGDGQPRAVSAPWPGRQDGRHYRANRYDRPLARACASCHARVVSGKSGIREHDLHGYKVGCWICHAQPYMNCYGCHGTRSADGKLIFDSQREELDLKIGRLPEGVGYSLVRHVPVTRDTFALFGADLLSRFDAVPTWKRATPHNIQRRTPQNASCEACHTVAELWLQASDLEPGDAKANQAVATEPVRLPPSPR